MAPRSLDPPRSRAHAPRVVRAGWRRCLLPSRNGNGYRGSSHRDEVSRSDVLRPPDGAHPSLSQDRDQLVFALEDGTRCHDEANITRERISLSSTHHRWPFRNGGATLPPEAATPYRYGIGAGNAISALPTRETRPCKTISLCRGVSPSAGRRLSCVPDRSSEACAGTLDERDQLSELCQRRPRPVESRWGHTIVAQHPY
jgi:hypothetical protein